MRVYVRSTEVSSTIESSAKIFVSNAVDVLSAANNAQAEPETVICSAVRELSSTKEEEESVRRMVSKKIWEKTTDKKSHRN
jgi:hypothetical protein